MISDQAQGLRRKVEEKPEKHAKIITITSGKGGVGKSNITANLGIQLQKLGNRVVIIDTDFGFANIEVLLGLTPKYNFLDIIQSQKSILDVLSEGPFGMKYISGASEFNQIQKLSKEDFIYFIENLKLLDDIADFILVDTGAGISETMLHFLGASDDIIIITTPEPTAITDAYVILKSIFNSTQQMAQDRLNVNLIVNLVESFDEGEEIFQKFYKVSNRFLGLEIDKIGYIPYDKNIKAAVRNQVPISVAYPNSISVQSFHEIAHNLLQHKFEQKQFKTKGITSLVSNFIETFRKNR